MIDIILFILIGLKLDMMNGLYQTLIIIYIILWIISTIIKLVKGTLALRKKWEDER